MTATGHVYKIICTIDEKFCYIGSTFNRLSKRFELLKKDFLCWQSDKSGDKSADKSGDKSGVKSNKRTGNIGKSLAELPCFLYFEKFGVENFKIILIKDYEVCRDHVKDRRHLGAYETLWICKTKCVNTEMPITYFKKELSEADRDQIKKKQREYREKNSEYIAKKQKEYRVKNKEHIANKYKEWCQKNREHIAQKRREYRQKVKNKTLISK